LPGGSAFTANTQAVATGEYPLFHYLYVSCRPGSGALASGFVTFLSSGRGQRLVSRAGYLPAREVPRPIQLTSRPIGSQGT
jgi:ABC-type phosphate transport system substrate-binding protein